MRSALFFTAGLVLLGFLSTTVRGDACTFTTTWGTTTVASYSQISKCFDAVPFSPTFRDQTVAAMNQLFNLYSFTDIATNSGAPFNIQVNVWSELKRISSMNYSSDYDMVADFQTVFNKLYDGHTQYTAPAPYAGWNLLRPFVLATNLSNGNLVFTVSSENTLLNKPFTFFYQGAFNGASPSVNLTTLVGKTISQINGMPTLNYLQSVADSQGTYKSAGVRLNALLKGGFATVSGANAPFAFGAETYTFSDGTVANFSSGLPFIYQNLQYNSVASLLALLPAPSSKRDEAPTPRYKMAVRRLPPFEEMLRQQALEKRVLNARASSLNVLNASIGNAVIAASTVINGVEYVVLQLTTFSSPDGYTDAQQKAWIISFQAAVKAAVDYGQSKGINSLIIDLSNNGGGIVCLSVATRIALFPGYASNPGAASCPSDYRLGSTSNKISNIVYALYNGQEVPQCGTSTITDGSWYSPASTHTRGGVTSAYTNANMFADNCFNGNTNLLYSNPAYLNWTPTWFFSKVVALTDGTCGSACSQFLSEAMADGTITALSYGGRPDSVTDTSSFCGGNVETWPTFVKNANAVSANTGATLSNLPTTASMQFNYMESYVGGGSLPREFTQMPATANLNIWPVGSQDITAALYSQAVTYFSSAASSPTTITCKKAVPGNTGASTSTSSSSPSSVVESSFVETLRHLF